MRNPPYDIKQLIYPAMIGGIISIIILGTQNAKRLQIKSNILQLLMFLGPLILLGEIFVVSFLMDEGNPTMSQVYLSLFRTLPILFYFLYYSLTKKAFEAAKVEGIIPISLGRNGLLWTFVGLFGELVIVFSGNRLVTMLL
jgi:hypothetical protein